MPRRRSHRTGGGNGGGDNDNDNDHHPLVQGNPSDPFGVHSDRPTHIVKRFLLGMYMGIELDFVVNLVSPTFLFSCDEFPDVRTRDEFLAMMAQARAVHLRYSVHIDQLFGDDNDVCCRFRVEAVKLEGGVQTVTETSVFGVFETSDGKIEAFFLMATPLGARQQSTMAAVMAHQPMVHSAPSLQLQSAPHVSYPTTPSTLMRSNSAVSNASSVYNQAQSLSYAQGQIGLARVASATQQARAYNQAISQASGMGGSTFGQRMSGYQGGSMPPMHPGMMSMGGGSGGFYF